MGPTVLVVMVVVSMFVVFAIIAHVRGSSPRRARSTTHSHDWSSFSGVTFGDGGSSDCGVSDSGGADCGGGGDGGGGGSD